MYYASSKDSLGQGSGAGKMDEVLAGPGIVTKKTLVLVKDRPSQARAAAGPGGVIPAMFLYERVA